MLKTVLGCTFGALILAGVISALCMVWATTPSNVGGWCGTVVVLALAAYINLVALSYVVESENDKP